MNILLTGLPRSGKTTLLANVLKEINSKKGFITQELRGATDRTGFEVVAHDGDSLHFADIAFRSEFSVSRYGIHINAFNDWIERFFEPGPAELLYIDEIGEAQWFSPRFRALVNQYLDAATPLIGTISEVFKDEQLLAIKKRSDVELFELTPETREETAAAVSDALRRALSTDRNRR